jgi:hypothetical protein
MKSIRKIYSWLPKAPGPWVKTLPPKPSPIFEERLYMDVFNHMK